MAGSACHKKEDDVLRLRRKLRLLRRQRVGSLLGKPGPGEEMIERNRAKADSALFDKPATGIRHNGIILTQRRKGAEGCAFAPLRYSFVIASSRFNRTRLTATQAAISSILTPFARTAGLSGSAVARFHGFSSPATK